MFRKAIAIFTFITVANFSQSQDIACWTTCNASSPISSANVLGIRSSGVDGGAPTEIRWHPSEPILIMLDERVLVSAQYLLVLEVFEGTPYLDIGGPILGHSPLFQQLEVLSDTIIVGTTDGTLLFWDLWEEEFLYEVPVSEGKVSELLLHPSGDWRLVAIDHSNLYRFDLASQSIAEIRLPGDHDRSLQNLAISQGGLLLAASGNGTIRIWSIGSWDAWEPAVLPFESAADLLFTNEDSQMLVLSDATISRWSLHGNELRFVRQLEPIAGKRGYPFVDGDISLDGTLLMTIDDCGLKRAWDLTLDSEILVPQFGSLSEHTKEDERGQGREVLFSPDGRYLANTLDGQWGLRFIEDQG